jgi:hypothetical protein
MCCQPTHVCHATSATLHRLHTERGRVTSRESRVTSHACPFQSFETLLRTRGLDGLDWGERTSRRIGRNAPNPVWPAPNCDDCELCEGDDGTACPTMI